MCGAVTLLRAERLQQAAARCCIAYSVFPDAVCPFIADYMMDIYHNRSVLRNCGVSKHSEIPLIVGSVAVLRFLNMMMYTLMMPNNAV